MKVDIMMTVRATVEFSDIDFAVDDILITDPQERMSLLIQNADELKYNLSAAQVIESAEELEIISANHI